MALLPHFWNTCPCLKVIGIGQPLTCPSIYPASKIRIMP